MSKVIEGAIVGAVIFAFYLVIGVIEVLPY
jgi:hypothetical protein